MGTYPVKYKKKKNGKIIRIKKWRWEFRHKGKRYQSPKLYSTRTESVEEELKKLTEIRNPPKSITQKTFLTLLELVNRKLMDLKAYRSEKHFKDIQYLARGWADEWSEYTVDQITPQMVKDYAFKRGQVFIYGDNKEVKKPHTANKEIKFLRALFTWGKKQDPPLCMNNPAMHIPYFPVEKFIKYVPPIDDITKVLWAADQDERDYLYTIWDTKGRMGEINKLAWEDVCLDIQDDKPWKRSYVVLYSRKGKDGSREGRKVPLTKRLYNILLRRYKERDKHYPWVFWHRYWSRKANEFVEGPYTERSKLMKTLCEKAGVRYFRYHALRHSGASIMDENPNTKTRTIMRVLGHKRESTTEKYLHSLGEAEILAMEEFERDSTHEGIVREEEEKN